ncbi:MAG: nitrogenase [Deltaproteobacteria bacterium]|jgi:nitrogenase molybdenum-iron protein alpha chain|nr:nitrogenase [Deltaproteobacteria bacterium]
MSHLDAPTAPRREDRLGACIEFGGGVGEIREPFCQGCLKNRRRLFSQGTICQLLPAIAILTSLKDTVVVVHGAVGCGGAAHALGANVRLGQWRSGDKNPRGALWISTNLSERDVTTGGEERLREAIVEADRRHRPEAIVILSACVPGIIGDDIEGVARDLKNRVGAALLPVHCEGFKTKIMATAYDAIFHSFLRNLIDGRDESEFPVWDDEGARAREAIRRKRLVNLMNVSSMTGPDLAELRRLLGKLGLEANVIPCDVDPEAFRRAPLASLSVGVCPTHDDYFMSRLLEKFGVPYVCSRMPIGIENTGVWLRAVAGKTGTDHLVEGVVKAEEAELELALAPLRPKLLGKKVMLSAGEVRTLATANMCAELGLEVLAVRPYHYDQFGEPEVERLGKVAPGARLNVATAQPFEAVNILRRVEPDLYIGHNSDNVWAAKCGPAVLPIYGSNFVYSGYAGVFEVARRAVMHLANSSFNQNLAKNVRQPYRRDWYAQDPFKYIKDGGRAA